MTSPTQAPRPLVLFSGIAPNPWISSMRMRWASESVGYSHPGSGAAPRQGMSCEDATMQMRSQS
eukprot:7487026-Heterocapsa_arctica.AAC.1